MIFYVDGSTHPTNPGPGGFGVVILDNEKNLLYTYNKQFELTTNNRMELMAILYVMGHYGRKEKNAFNLNDYDIPTVYSDSAYAINTLSNWCFQWEKRGWLKQDGSEPENLDIIQAYWQLYQLGLRIELKKIKAHQKGEIWNNLADKLAKGE